MTERQGPSYPPLFNAIYCIFHDAGVQVRLFGFMAAHTDPGVRAVVECETAALKLTMSFTFNRRSAVAAN